MNEFSASQNFKVISVNPSQKTVGAKYSGLLKSMTRHCRPIEVNIKAIRLKTLVNIVSGINKNINEAMSGKLLLARCLVGISLICFAILKNISSISMWIGLGIGTALILGFQTRILSTASALMLSVISLFKFFPDISIIDASQIEIYLGKAAAGIPLYGIECVLTAIIFAALAFFGPGKYSADQIIRQKVFRAIKRNSNTRNKKKREHLAAERLSYRAFMTD